MKERFISDEENTNIVKYILIVISYVFASIFITVLLTWAYNASNDNQYMFIFAVTFFTLVYASGILTIVIINKSIYDEITYMSIIGTSIFTMFFMFFIGLFFIYKYITTRKVFKPVIVNQYGQRLSGSYQ